MTIIACLQLLLDFNDFVLLTRILSYYDSEVWHLSCNVVLKGQLASFPRVTFRVLTSFNW